MVCLRCAKWYPERAPLNVHLRLTTPFPKIKRGISAMTQTSLDLVNDVFERFMGVR